MTKTEYNESRPRIECPNCGKYITKANFSRHYNACINTNSKLNSKNSYKVYKLDHDDLYCKFCNKECKNTNSLTQHELRCPNNPNRRDYLNLAKYSTEYRKGQNADTCIYIAKQRKTLLDKYANGYISPKLGERVEFDYIYKEHNDSQIAMWLNYVDNNNFVFPYVETIKHENRYTILKHKYRIIDDKHKIIFEHDFIANILLNNNLHFSNTVHHIDKNPVNNDIHNLLVFIDGGNHKRFHNSKYAYLIYDENTHLFSCELRK